ncbi:MYXO-CTERM sorting domain-containing protein [Geodermatophilus sp. DSM 45219]|nr:MYXO-CTERM sorting domain-containing protein [Geodermatophilus sp. DSM 45219]SDN41115.1 Myxococcales GC_trans_RRR domain-containing protein [Geodermatophilus sp. DSM 45219]
MLVTTTDLIVIGTITVVVLVLGLLVWLLGRNR